MRTLRDYQARGNAEVRRLLALQHNPILVSPTGSGKTYAAASLVEEIGAPTLWVAHRHELIGQAFKQLCGLGLRVGVIAAGEPENRFAQVQVASVQTLARRGNPADATWLTIIDEVHHATANSYASLFATGSRVVGLTATPFRLDGAGLGDLFSAIVVAATPKELVDRGILVRPRVLCAPAPDFRKVRLVAGDYNITDAAAAMDTGRIVGDVVKTWLERANGRKSIVFAVNIAHSQHLAEAFRAAGVRAAHVDGDTDTDTRDRTLAELRDGRLDVVCNVNLFTEGWDLPALSCCVIAKPTASLGLHQQMCGRVARIAEGKADALILDHAGNHLRHGELIRDLEYTLHVGVVAAATGPNLGLRVCTNCYCMFPTTGWVCPQCQTDNRPPAPPMQTVPGNLRDFIDTSYEGRLKEWERIEGFRLAGGWAESWATNEYRRRFGVFPVLVGRRLIDPVTASVEDRAAVWAAIDVRRVGLGYDRGWTDHQYKQIFGRWPSPEIRSAHAKVKVEEATAGWTSKKWSGKAKTAGAQPSKKGATENPYAEPEPAHRQAWQPRTPRTKCEFENPDAAARFLLETAGIFDGRIGIRDVVDDFDHRRTVYRMASMKVAPRKTGDDETQMVRVNNARDVIDLYNDEIPF